MAGSKCQTRTRLPALIKGARLCDGSIVGAGVPAGAGVGVCGKDGQSVPVGVGQPTLLLDNLTVGGTEA